MRFQFVEDCQRGFIGWKRRFQISTDCLVRLIIPSGEPAPPTTSKRTEFAPLNGERFNVRQISKCNAIRVALTKPFEFSAFRNCPAKNIRIGLKPERFNLKF